MDAARSPALPAPTSSSVPSLPAPLTVQAAPSVPVLPPPTATPSIATVDAPQGSTVVSHLDVLPRPWQTLPDAPSPTVEGLVSARRRRAERYGEPVSPVARAVVVVTAVGANLIALCGFIWVVWDRRSLVGEFGDGRPVTAEQLDAADGRVASAITAVLLAAVVVAPALMVWMHRTYRNVGAWRPIDHGVGWTVGGWFVPFMNLVRPGRIMVEIVENSPMTGRGAGLVWFWWIAWLAPWAAGAVIGNIEASTPASYVRRETLVICTAAVLVVAAVLLIVIVARATFDQRRHIAANAESEQIVGALR